MWCCNKIITEHICYNYAIQRNAITKHMQSMFRHIRKLHIHRFNTYSCMIKPHVMCTLIDVYNFSRLDNIRHSSYTVQLFGPGTYPRGTHYTIRRILTVLHRLSAWNSRFVIPILSQQIKYIVLQDLKITFPLKCLLDTYPSMSYAKTRCDTDRHCLVY